MPEIMKTKLSTLCDCACSFPLNRRALLETTVTGVAAAATGCVSVTKEPRDPVAVKSQSETLVATLYKSLNEEQRKAVAFPFDHPLRSQVDNNWHITDKKLAQFFSKDQQEMVRQIFVGLHSAEYAEKVMQQVVHDSGQEGFGYSSVAL